MTEIAAQSPFPLVIRVGQQFADSRHPGSQHQRGSLCPGKRKLLAK